MLIQAIESGRVTTKEQLIDADFIKSVGANEPVVEPTVEPNNPFGMFEQMISGLVKAQCEPTLPTNLYRRPGPPEQARTTRPNRRPTRLNLSSTLPIRLNRNISCLGSLMPMVTMMYDPTHKRWDISVFEGLKA